MGKELPKNWVDCKLGDLLTLRNGYAFKSNEYKSDGIPVIRISDIQQGDVNTENAVYVDENEGLERFLIENGDVLVAMSGATTGKYGVYYSNEKAYQNQRVGNFKPYSNELFPRTFIYYLLGGLKKEIEDQAYGGAQPNISSRMIESLPVSIPPLPEQQRIVAKLDSLFAHLEEVKTRLEKVPELIKQFRQSVLTQAVTGKLTEEWRLDNEYDVTELINDIEKIRRQNWEERKRKEFYAKGKEPNNDNWKSTYKKPLNVKSRIFSTIPDGWGELVWDQISDWVTYGFTRPMPHTEEGFPIITGKNIYSGRIHFENYHFTDEESYQALNDKDRPIKGDLLITKDGSIGRAAIVDSDQPFCINQSVAVAWLRNSPMLRKYLLYVVMTDEVQNEIKLHSKGVAIQHLSVTDFRQMQVPIPSLEEQTEIVRRVEVLFAKADAIEKQYEQLKAKIDVLPQALLAKAFRGELVEQLPEDGDARELLEEIRKQKNKTQKSGKKEKKEISLSQIKNKKALLNELRMNIQRILKGKDLSYKDLINGMKEKENLIETVIDQLIEEGVISQRFDENDGLMKIHLLK